MAEEETDNKPDTKVILLSQVLAILRRPLEFGLIGLSLVGVVFIAERSNVLPKILKGFGVEVEFHDDQQRIVQAALATEQDITSLQNSVKALEEKLAVATLVPGQASTQPTGVQTAALVANENAPRSEADSANKSSPLVDQKQTLLKEGFMWLGTYDPKIEGWSDQSIKLQNGDVLPAPSTLSGQAIVLTRTVNIRESFPPDNDVYFRAVRALGVADTGTSVNLLAPPKIYEREETQQIWAHVEVSLRPYIGVASSQ